MSFKDKISSLLSGHKSRDKEEADVRQMPDEPKVPEISDFDSAEEAVLKLPPEHLLFYLHSIRRKEVGSLPMPRLCMDEDGVLPEDVVRREKNRLENSLGSICSSRLKFVGNESRERQKREQEKEVADFEAVPEGLDALPWFFLSADKLYAWMLIFPPSGPGREISRDMIYQAMEVNDITYGVNTRLVDRLSHDENRYFNLFLIAKGKPAFDGKNGNIVDYVPRVIERSIQIDEYDQVDYTALNLTYNVKEGQEICRMIRPTEGEPGYTVLSQEIPAKKGKSVPLPKGRNTEASEDGDVLIASISGHVEFTGRSFQVKPVLEIDGDVDFSTGNIRYVGDVNIKGDVTTGFTVRAMGSVWVGGVVEAGSTVEAGGDLTVVKGILGDGTTNIRVHRSIFSKYIENVTLCVRENLQTDAIINSNIYCDGEVVVRSGRGSILGGHIWAAKKVSATSVGARSECRTAITLGGPPCAIFEHDIAKRELIELEVERETLECQPASPVKEALLAKMRMKLSTAELKLKQLEDELLGIEELPKESAARLECSIAHPGTEISIGEKTMRIWHENRQCVVKMVEGEIVVT